MSKRRQTIATAPVTDSKKTKLDETVVSEECDNIPVTELSDKQLRQSLSNYGETPGPVMPSTRSLYERLLQKHRNGEVPPKEPFSIPPPKPNNQSTPTRPNNQSTPARSSKINVKPKLSKKKTKSPVIAEDSSPEILSPTTSEVDIESLPDPPSTSTKSPPITSPKVKRTPVKPAKSNPSPNRNQTNIENFTNKQIRDQLVELGETPGPINNMNRKLYVELLAKHQRGELAHTVAARKLSKDGKDVPVAVMSSTRIDDQASSRRRSGADRTRPILSGNGASKFPQTIDENDDLEDYPDEEEMEVVDPSLCVSYAKSPYKKTRRSICKAEFTSTDFVVFSSTSTPSNRPSYYHELKNSGIQALVTQDCSTIALVNVVKAARGCVKIYTGVTISTIKEGRIAVSNALQCGSVAVVIGFSKPECVAPAAIASSIKQVMEGHLTASYFYYHNSVTKACSLRISKQLLEHNNGFQGIFVSPESEEKLLLLESLGIKIYETDSTKILRSLAHGIDSSASFEGIIATPVIRKLKEEYYEGNTSESCRLQLILCRLFRALTKHGDLLPSLHTALRYLGMEAGELPPPLQPLRNEVPLLKDLAELNVDKWN